MGQEGSVFCFPTAHVPKPTPAKQTDPATATPSLEALRNKPLAVIPEDPQESQILERSAKTVGKRRGFQSKAVLIHRRLAK